MHSERMIGSEILVLIEYGYNRPASKVQRITCV